MSRSKAFTKETEEQHMELTFSLSPVDAERLFAIKQMQDCGDLTGTEFARQLLERELYRLFPAAPEFDETGRLINPEKYKGA